MSRLSITEDGRKRCSSPEFYTMLRDMVIQLARVRKSETEIIAAVHVFIAVNLTLDAPKDDQPIYFVERDCLVEFIKEHRPDVEAVYFSALLENMTPEDSGKYVN